MRAHTRLLVAGAVAFAVLLGVGYVLLITHDGSSSPKSADLDARELAVEHQLLCPQCMNERLDVCNLAICNDMKAVIRQRLQAGDPPEVIVAYFRDRYGERVLARVPAQGFNLVLFGWVGGSLAMVALIGGFFLFQLRRPAGRAGPAPAAGAPSPDDAWLDRQLAESEDDA